MNKQVIEVYEFGKFRLNVAEGKLFCQENLIPLTPKAFETLVVLLKQHGQIIDKETLINAVWHDAFVEEGSLARNISVLRKALGDIHGSIQYIETLPRRGYRFIATVNKLNGENSNLKRTIAILPFKVLTENEELTYLGLGMTDALITHLSNISELVVRPTRAVQKYTEDIDAVEIGKELQVETVLDGRILCLGDQLRVTVQLISVERGQTIWGDKFDEEMTDMFTVQDLIAERVAKSLLVKFTDNGQKRLNKSQTKNPQAYRNYVRGRFYWNKRTSEDNQKAITCFQESVESDPDFALAYHGLADAYLISAQHSMAPPRKAFPVAKAFAEKALSLDESLAEAYTSLAHANFLYDWDWEKAEKGHRKALTLKPNYAMGRHWYGAFLAAMGRFDESLAEIKEAHLLDPLSPIIIKSGASVLSYARRTDEAIAQYNKVLELESNFASALSGLGLLYSLLGEHEKAINLAEKAFVISVGETGNLGLCYASGKRQNEARSILNKLLQTFENGYSSPFDIALIYMELGENDEAFKWFEKAYEMRDSSFTYIKVYPGLERFRSDSRFANLLSRMNLNNNS
jgi:TolB-like protein/Tfp pilus assembly protein PilF